VARSTHEDVDRALDAAHAAAVSWNVTSATTRSIMLNKIADRMEANLESLAFIETIDNGKPIRETTHADLPLADRPLPLLRRRAARPGRAASARLDNDTVAYHFHEPLGVVGQIIPWNFPLLMAVVEARPRPRGRELRRAQAGRADAV
jgi:aldehyde dehydrogenase